MSIATLRLASEASSTIIDRHSPHNKASLVTGGRHSSLRDQSITRDWRSSLFAQRARHHSLLSVATLRSEIKASLAIVRRPPPSDQSITRDWRSAVYRCPSSEASLETIGRHPSHNKVSLAIIDRHSSYNKASLATIGRHSSLRDQSITRDCPSTSAQRSKHHSRLAIVTLRSANKASLATVGRHSSPSDQSITRDWRLTLFVCECITRDCRSFIVARRAKHHS